MFREGGGTGFGRVPHVNVSHPRDSPHTTLVSLHVAVHQMGVLPIGDPVVARWGRWVAVNDFFARVSWIVGSPWALCWIANGGWCHCSLCGWADALLQFMTLACCQWEQGEEEQEMKRYSPQFATVVRICQLLAAAKDLYEPETTIQ